MKSLRRPLHTIAGGVGFALANLALMLLSGCQAQQPQAQLIAPIYASPASPTQALANVESDRRYAQPHLAPPPQTGDAMASVPFERPGEGD